ncbi:MAG: GTPase HflX [Nannocystaceae bacterium]
MADRNNPPSAVLVAVQLPGVTDTQHTADLAELGRLAKTLGLQVVGVVSQRRPGLSPATVLGEGKLLELAAWTGGSGEVEAHIPGKIASERRKEHLRQRDEPDEGDEDEDEDEDEDQDEHELDAQPPTPTRPSLYVAPEDPAKAEELAKLAADPPRPAPPAYEEMDFDEDVYAVDKEIPRAQVIVVDHQLTPRMQRNLERATGAEVMDRTHLIVEIFHRHAQSREAKLQVEIARLTYVAPRLREAGAGADRQRGGIGGKGSGESALELDRRKIRDRIAELRKELAQIERNQRIRRSARQNQRRVALVGYTNAGKSSLMRALTSSGVYVADKLFATLDTTVRALQPETDPRVLVSDTVGFIKKLPHELVASFRSTLDEALEASLLIFVVDASDPSFRDQLAVAKEVLAEIGADSVVSRLVLNKRDQLKIRELHELEQEFPEALNISAHNPDDVVRVRDLIVSFFDGEMVETELFVSYAQRGLIRHVYEDACVLGERHSETGTHFDVRAPQAVLERLRSRLDDQHETE